MSHARQVEFVFPKSNPPAPKALSVTQLVRRIRNVVEVQVGEVWIEGEISNLKKQASGHWYFSLKDDAAQIQCAMFGARKRSGHEVIEDGAKVRVFAEASVYEARGQLQIIVQKAERAGVGDLQARFEALKQRLNAEGLFDAAHKKPLPRFPRTIGIITSDTGAAIRDVLNVLGRRAPWVQPVLMPVRVQGAGAERQIARAIEQMGAPRRYGLPICDVLIVGRGGGSIEDLWCFNEEIVARAIFACPIPIVSAVGHEIDFTIADFVADLRAPTPSAAAELAVPDSGELMGTVANLRRRMEREVREKLQGASRRLDFLKRGPLQRGGGRLLREPAMQLDTLRSKMERALAGSLETMGQRLAEVSALHRANHPVKVLERRAERLDLLRRHFQRGAAGAIQGRQRKLSTLLGLLKALGPEATFQRGFTITMDENGKVVRSASEATPGKTFRTRFKDGEVRSTVTDVPNHPL